MRKVVAKHSQLSSYKSYATKTRVFSTLVEAAPRSVVYWASLWVRSMSDTARAKCIGLLCGFIRWSKRWLRDHTKVTLKQNMKTDRL